MVTLLLFGNKPLYEVFNNHFKSHAALVMDAWYANEFWANKNVPFLEKHWIQRPSIIFWSFPTPTFLQSHLIQDKIHGQPTYVMDPWHADRFFATGNFPFLEKRRILFLKRSSQFPYFCLSPGLSPCVRAFSNRLRLMLCLITISLNSRQNTESVQRKLMAPSFTPLHSMANCKYY